MPQAGVMEHARRAPTAAHEEASGTEMIAIVESWRSGGLRRAQWLPNVVAGLIVGVVALPLAMAFGIASGVKPEQGLYTAIIAGLIVSLFGGSRIQIAGPTGAFIVILAGVVAKHGVDGLLIATMMAGLMLVVLGLARFGGVIRFIPDPVIAGFTAGIGVIIWVGQWRDFFGLPKPGGEQFYDRLWQLLKLLPQWHPATTLLAALSLALVLLGPRLPGLKRVPGPLIAMVAATALQSAFGFDGVATIGSAFGGIPQGLPAFTLPTFDFDRIVALVPAAFTIAMLGAIESLLSAVVADNLAGTRHDSNQELIAQGLANLAAPLFGGIAATGAIARTATNHRNGGSSPLAGVVHALVLVAVLLFLAPLAARIPLCALAAILFAVSWNMSEPHKLLTLARTAPRADVAILAITFVLTVLTDLVIAVNIGVILAMLQFLRRMASSVAVRPMAPRELALALDGEAARVPADTQVFLIEGPLFFGAIESLDRAFERLPADTRRIVIRLGGVPFMDITGIHALQAAMRELQQRGIEVQLCEAKLRVLRKLLRAGVVRREERRYFGRLALALAPDPASDG